MMAWIEPRLILVLVRTPAYIGDRFPLPTSFPATAWLKLVEKNFRKSMRFGLHDLIAGIDPMKTKCVKAVREGELPVYRQVPVA